MDELAKIREELDRSFDYKNAAEDALLAHRRRSKELEAAEAEQRSTNPALPPRMRG